MSRMTNLSRTARAHDRTNSVTVIDQRVVLKPLRPKFGHSWPLENFPTSGRFSLRAGFDLHGEVKVENGAAVSRVGRVNGYGHGVSEALGDR
jgi:hypothetical protein